MHDVLQLEPVFSTDMSRLNAIARQIHVALPERPEVFAEKCRLYPAGCRKFIWQGDMVGYGIAHLWQRYAIPPLDGFLNSLPANPDCLYMHDVVLTPEARGKGGVQHYVAYIKHLAKMQGVSSLALVAVYGTTVMWARCGFADATDDDVKDKLASYGEGARYMVCDV